MPVSSLSASSSPHCPDSLCPDSRCPHSRKRLLSGVLAAALLVAGCSSAGSDATADTTATTLTKASTSTSEQSEVESALVEEPPDTDEDDGQDLVFDDGSTQSSIGDPLFEGLGNGGYDALHYDLSIDTTSNPEHGAIDGVAVITLVAQEDLPRFNLDIEGLVVDDVTIDGEPARFDHAGGELTIRPTEPLSAGSEATVSVTYHGLPVPLHDVGDVFELGWQAKAWGSYVVSEPIGAANWFPSNNHPGDKATFQLAITVEEGLTAAGPGSLIEQTEGDGTVTFVYSMPYQMATYLASVVTGDFVIDESEGPNGVTIRNVLHAPSAEAMRPILDRTSVPMLELFDELFGPYPFDNYGIVAVPEPLGFALENQTLSVFGVDTVTFDSIFTEQILAHELAHQWFGDAVSVAEWDDIWLNEGFATWADAYWLEQNGQEFFSVLDQYNQSSGLGPLKGLHAADLFGENVYVRGGLTLEALRRTVGDDAFFSFLQSWVQAHSGGTASTADFLSLVDSTFGEDTQQLMKAWIFSDVSPELPAK